MAPIHGKNAVVAFGTSGSESDISAYCNKSDLDQAFDEAEVSAYGSSAKSYVIGLGGNKFDIAGPWSQTLHNILQPLVGVAGKSIVYGPAGNTTGLPKLSATAHLKDYKVSGAVNGAVTWTGSITIDGGVTNGTY